MHSDFFPFISSNSFFVDPLLSYKRKDDLVALSGALGLKITGTIHELITQVKSHIDAHPKIQHNDHFSALFLPSQRCQVENGLKNSVEMGNQ